MEKNQSFNTISFLEENYNQTEAITSATYKQEEATRGNKT